LAGFKEAAVSMSEIELYARQIESKHAMFVFDTCFAGSIFQTSRGVTPLGPRLRAQLGTGAGASQPSKFPEIRLSNISEVILYKVSRPVRQFIAAGTAEQTAPDQSYFRAQFVEGLKGAADINRDGYVTGSELGVFLQDTVARHSRGTQTPQWGTIRDPRLDKGDFVFALAPTR
jgi:hypothetical protein